MLSQSLRFFCVCAKEKSFTRAARKLYCSPASVYKRINQFEKELNLKVFERSHQGIQLTRAGKILYEEALKMQEMEKEALAKARAISLENQMTIRIGTSLLNPGKELMERILQIKDPVCSFRLEMVPFEDDHASISKTISSLGSSIDLILGVNDSPEWKENTAFYPLKTIQHAIAVPASHPLAAKESLCLHDLKSQTVYCVPAGHSPSVDAAREILETIEGIHLEDTSDFYDLNVFNSVLEKKGLLLLPECWKDVFPAFKVFDMDWNTPIQFGILCSLQANPSLTALLKKLQRQSGWSDSESKKS